MSILEQSGFIDVSGRAIYGTHYLPADAPLRAALLLAEPSGEEKRCAFSMLVRLARPLPTRGGAGLRGAGQFGGFRRLRRDPPRAHGPAAADGASAAGAASRIGSCFPTYDDGAGAVDGRGGYRYSQMPPVNSPGSRARTGSSEEVTL